MVLLCFSLESLNVTCPCERLLQTLTDANNICFTQPASPQNHETELQKGKLSLYFVTDNVNFCLSTLSAHHPNFTAKMICSLLLLLAVQMLHTLFCTTFHGLCQPYDFMERKQLCFLGEAEQMNNRSPQCKHLAKTDTEKEPTHIGPTWMLNLRQSSFWLAAVVLSVCTQPSEHQL